MCGTRDSRFTQTQSACQHGRFINGSGKIASMSNHAHYGNLPSETVHIFIITKLPIHANWRNQCRQWCKNSFSTSTQLNFIAAFDIFFTEYRVSWRLTTTLKITTVMHFNHTQHLKCALQVQHMFLKNSTCARVTTSVVCEHPLKELNEAVVAAAPCTAGHLCLPSAEVHEHSKRYSF